MIRIHSDALSAEIDPFGAELHRLQDAEGRDLLWDGDPAFWTGRAPILFPVIGCIAGGVIRVGGRDYPMPKHGFARHKSFTMVAQAADRATFRLEADDETRAAYPFEFRLDISFTLSGGALSIDADLFNPADAPLPASFGFHPALRWPLPWGATRADHRIRFEAPEPAPIRRIDNAGLLRAQPEPTPVRGRNLPLEDALFVDDALIFDSLASRQLTYGAPNSPSLHIAFPAMPLLGVWTKPGAGFLCIEPWQGIADPEGFTGEFRDKPGVIEVPPRSSHIFALQIAIQA